LYFINFQQLVSSFALPFIARSKNPHANLIQLQDAVSGTTASSQQFSGWTALVVRTGLQ
jgi:hypothetical protein